MTAHSTRAGNWYQHSILCRALNSRREQLIMVHSFSIATAAETAAEDGGEDVVQDGEGAHSCVLRPVSRGTATAQ